jgi:hypothetical protein
MGAVACTPEQQVAPKGLEGLVTFLDLVILHFLMPPCTTIDCPE